LQLLRPLQGSLKIGMSKKTGKPIKPRKPEKKITEKTEPKKKTD
jgi:hypothetical protein